MQGRPDPVGGIQCSGAPSRPPCPAPLQRLLIRNLLEVTDIGSFDLKSSQIVPRGRHYLQMFWIQAPPPKVIQRVMLAAEQQSVAVPVTAVVAHRNDVRCFYDLWWRVT